MKKLLICRLVEGGDLQTIGTIEVDGKELKPMNDVARRLLSENQGKTAAEIVERYQRGSYLVVVWEDK